MQAEQPSLSCQAAPVKDYKLHCAALAIRHGCREAVVPCRRCAG